MEGVDYAFSTPSPGALFQAGKRFAMRYVGPGSDPKHLTVAEATALNRAGLWCVTLVEGAVGDPKFGFNMGVTHAKSALTMCRARGYPTSVPMYFAVDYDVSSTSWPSAREYLRGAGTVIGPQRVGVYGEYDAMVWAKRDGVASWFFQTYAWSAGRWYGGNHVEQYRNGVSLAGGIVDLCRSKQADFGQWSLISPHPEEGDMLIQVRETLAVWTVDAARTWRRSISNTQELASWKGAPVTPVAQAEVNSGWWGVDVALAVQPSSGPGGLAPHTHDLAAGETGEAVASNQ
jgi:hypothetical protein